MGEELCLMLWRLTGGILCEHGHRVLIFAIFYHNGNTMIFFCCWSRPLRNCFHLWFLAAMCHLVSFSLTEECKRELVVLCPPSCCNMPMLTFVNPILTNCLEGSSLFPRISHLFTSEKACMMHTYTWSNFAIGGKAGRGQIVFFGQPKWQKGYFAMDSQW